MADRLRILVPGANGQVGRELLATLAPFGCVIPAVRAPAAHHSDAIAMNLARPETIRVAIRESRPDVIVNAAAYTAVDRAESEPELALAVNADGVRVIAEEAKTCGAALVHYSTDYVFDGGGTGPWLEDDTPSPLNKYGQTKLAGENVIRNAGVPHAILRTSWVYAPHGHNFVKSMLRLGLEREALSLVTDQIGAPTSAFEIALATAAVLRHCDGRPGDCLAATGGLYHMACAGETSWHGFACEIFQLARAAGLSLKVKDITPIPTSAYPTPAQRPLNSRLDCRKFVQSFSHRPAHWRDALVSQFPMLLETFQTECNLARDNNAA